MKKVYFIFLQSIIGMIVGFVSGLLASGGGMILLPFAIYGLKLSQSKARATTICCMFIIIFFTSIFYSNSNNFDYGLAIKCILGGIVGSFLGTEWLQKKGNNSNFIRYIFIAFLLYSAFRMLK